LIVTPRTMYELSLTTSVRFLPWWEILTLDSLPN
jgi:hypothetical protein